MTEKQIVLDNSARSTFCTCKKKYFYQNIQGLQSNYGSTALRYGSCWHAIQEGYHRWVMENGWPKSPSETMEAITAGLKLGKETYDADSAKKEYYDDYKNFNTAVEAFNAYLDYFESDKDFVEIISTEQKFECPMEPENTLEEKILSKLPPLIFTGRLDLGIKMDGTNWINDFKTTGWYLDKVIQQANRSAQFIGYSYAGKRVLDFEAQGCIGNFAYVGSTKSRKTGQWGKTRYQFRRVPQVYSEGDIQAWKLSFISTAREIHFAEQEGLYPESFDNCFQYGACSYLKLCQQHVPFEELNTEGFHVEFWNVLDD